MSKIIGTVKILDKGHGKDLSKIKVICIAFGTKYDSKNCAICQDKKCEDRITEFVK